MKKTGLLIACAWLLTGAARGDGLDNWPQWRGPLANGTAPKGDPPVTWDASTNVKWKAELPGRGSATPIVWGDQVFVVTAIKTDARRRTRRFAQARPAIREEDRLRRATSTSSSSSASTARTASRAGKRTANEQVPHEGHHPTHSYAAGSPTTDGKSLYVSFGSFGIYCYDLGGKLLWQRRDLGRLNTRLGWGEAVTPVVHGDSLLLNWDQEAESALVCLDARSRQDEVEDRARREDVVEHAAGGRTQGEVAGRSSTAPIGSAATTWRAARSCGSAAA